MHILLGLILGLNVATISLIKEVRAQQVQIMANRNTDCEVVFDGERKRFLNPDD